MPPVAPGLPGATQPSRPDRLGEDCRTPRRTDAGRIYERNPMNNPSTTPHRDGTVTYWSVYRQAWTRIDADRMSDETLATLTAAERARVARHAARD